MKISSIKEIMANEKLQMELENVQTDADFRKLCEKYDFSGFADTELDEAYLGAVSAGVNLKGSAPIGASSANLTKWVSKIIEEYAIK